MSFRKPRSSAIERSLSHEEEQAKISEVRKLLGPVADRFPSQCSDASILRFLRARNWNSKKATMMLKETLRWRLVYKPDKIRWDDVAREAETGKIYRANYLDKCGRTVLVIRPGFQNTNSVEGQIKYLVYCMESAISNMQNGPEQMVWLIDFQNWTMASISIRVTRETAQVLQDHYPERLAAAILYNPPKLFESFWLLVKPFLEHKTYRKVRFAYSDQPQSGKLMEALFDMDKLESTFGGRNAENFEFETYAKRMMDEEKQRLNATIDVEMLSDQVSVVSELQECSDIGSEVSDDAGSSCNYETGSDLECLDEIEKLKVTTDCGSRKNDVNDVKNNG